MKISNNRHMMKLLSFQALSMITVMLLSVGCADNGDKFSELRGPYLGQEDPGLELQLFAAGWVSTAMHEYHAIFSPDGDEFYFQFGRKPHVIMRTVMRDGRWSAPETVSFSGVYNDCEPCFSPDGRSLVFMSQRPHTDDDSMTRAGAPDLSADGSNPPVSASPVDKDIWIVEREGNEWGRPRNLGPPVNTDRNELYPVFSPDGDLYFSADWEGNVDIYLAKREGDGFATPERLGAEINTGHDDYDVAISPDGSYVIFSSAGRDDGIGASDLYISFNTQEGGWTKARNMGERMNSEQSEVAPTITPDGKYIFFSSTRSLEKGYYSYRVESYEELKDLLDAPGNGFGDIYWVNAEIVEVYRP